MTKTTLALILSLFVFGCAPKKNFNERDYLEFGRSIEALINAKKNDDLKNRIRISKVIQELSDGLESLGLSDAISEEKWKLYRADMYKMFAGAIQAFGQVKLFRFYEVNGSPHLIFEVVSENSEALVEFELQVVEDRIYLIDLHSINTGIRFSDAYVTNELNIRQYGRDYLNALKELKNVKYYLERKNPDRAWIAFQKIPEEFTYSSNFQSVKLGVARQVSDSLYIESLADWIGYQWEDQAFRYLRLAEYYSYFNEGDSTKKYLDSLERKIGPNFLIDKIAKRLSKE